MLDGLKKLEAAPSLRVFLESHSFTEIEKYRFDDGKSLKIACNMQQGKPDFALEAFVYSGEQDFGINNDASLHRLYYLDTIEEFQEVNHLYEYDDQPLVTVLNNVFAEA